MADRDQYSPTVEDVGPVLSAQCITLHALPVELLAEIFSELDLETLIVISCLSRRLRAITADTSLNPWRRPILRSLQRRVYEKPLFHLCVRSTVPRQNWIEILTFASPSFLLFDSTLPNLRSSEWEECFRRRFLPGWTKWKKDLSWRETFMKQLYRVWHRSRSYCTSDESWTKYIVLNRNGSLNELEGASRGFNPLSIFQEMKIQNNLAHLRTQIRVVLELMDVRIIALGVTNRPRTSLTVNPNARTFLHPPGLEPPDTSVDHNRQIIHPNTSDSKPSVHFNTAYRRLSYPMPSYTHCNYPMYTPGGSDQRWHPADVLLEEGMQWVGGLMVTAQLLPSNPDHRSSVERLQGLELFGGINRAQFASFTWKDFLAIAPWMEKRVTKVIHGQFLGIF